MEIEASAAARLMGVSPRRIRALAASGQVAGRRVAGRWVIDASSASPRAARIPRPMSHANAWALAQSAEGDEPSGLDATTRRRLRKALARIADEADPELVAAWLSARAARSLWFTSDPSTLIDDPRVVVAGVSDPRAGLGTMHSGEGYVAHGELAALIHDHLLTPAAPSSASVVLHAVPEGVEPPEATPMLWVVADLAEWRRPREMQAARALLERLR